MKELSLGVFLSNVSHVGINVMLVLKSKLVDLQKIGIILKKY